MSLAKSDPPMFGSSLANVFSAPAYDCRVLGLEQRPEFAVTRLRSGPREMEKAPLYPADNAILICVSLTPSAVGQWKSAIRRTRGWSHPSDPIRDDIYRSELSDGNVGSRPLRLLALLLFPGIACENCTRQRCSARVSPSRSVLHRSSGRGANDKEHSRASQTRRASRSVGTGPYRDGPGCPYFAATLRCAKVREQSTTPSIKYSALTGRAMERQWPARAESLRPTSCS